MHGELGKGEEEEVDWPSRHDCFIQREVSSAGGEKDGFIRWWRGLEKVGEVTTANRAGTISIVVSKDQGLSPEERVWYSGHDNGSINVWIGEKSIRRLLGHMAQVNSLLLVGEKLYSASDDNSIRIWEN